MLVFGLGRVRVRVRIRIRVRARVRMKVRMRVRVRDRFSLIVDCLSKIVDWKVISLGEEMEVVCSAFATILTFLSLLHPYRI